ncbi:3-isopropylmalate dehydratase small subunit 1 [Janthinobacterium sp. HH01]|uniref:3-isopropylmalate dehydratase small subunit n=1 Tax=Janthinobacterium sp. HH01 TaxID=1198452 RepID=UPI0002AEB94F|nr:3-isopropylmalate dehydratase small subunit [Janthinobacterium sp. HH01]ELX13072.1 3-isopropylmalate dehydratase small subunit 1 [Janthinobacterium sp. HH01]
MHHIEGIAAPLLIDNLDTDQIMPKQFLRIITKQGLDQGVLYDLRFDADGAPRPDFVLNREAYRGANILIGGANFGCGSSREHAVWGLQQLGIDVVIAASFGEIFFGNALNNRLLLIVLEPAQVAALAAEADAAPSRLAVDLDSMTVRSAGGVVAPFTLGQRHKQMITEGLDMVGATLRQLDAITAFEQQHWARHPWVCV